MKNTPLAGIRVLDLSQLLAGPYCTMLLADLGADVIKVEKPEQGDAMRGLAPHTYKAINRNKRSLVLNLKQDEGQRLFRKIAGSADIVVESYRPGTAEKLGVGYRAIREVNPAVIYCSITGYGQEGPYRNGTGREIDYPGIEELLGNLGRTGKKPPGLPIPHLSAALFAALSILSAFIARGKTGKGEYIDVAMTDGLMSWMSISSCDFVSGGRRQRKSDGMDRPSTKLFVTIPYRGAERLTLAKFPARSSNYRPTIYFPPPELGEHTEDILMNMGFTDADIEQLRERGVFGIGSPE